MQEVKNSITLESTWNRWNTDGTNKVWWGSTASDNIYDLCQTIWKDEELSDE